MYIELHAASAFSFLEGASLPEVLVDRAAELGYSSLALVDRDGVYGIPRFHKAALTVGIRPIVGAELTIAGTCTWDPPSGGLRTAPSATTGTQGAGSRKRAHLARRTSHGAPGTSHLAP